MRASRPVLFFLSALAALLPLAAGRASAECAHPAFTTSDPNGGWSEGGYYVHNNMWNQDYRLGPETLYACSHKDWRVVSNQKNDAGAVKTYPNVHKDYADVPLATFKNLTTTFAAASPHVGIYNVAYDIWLNGVASPGSNEVMIWTENFKQVPAGDKAGSVTLDGKDFDVWKTRDNGYIAFIPAAPMTSGSFDLRALFDWLLAQGWIPKASTLGQICFGIEIVSTDGAGATFSVTDFSIATAGIAIRGAAAKRPVRASSTRSARYSLTGRRLSPAD